MSDGNFNKSLLPSTPYRSGWNAGERRAYMKALETFKVLIKEKFPTLTDEELKSLTDEFSQRIK